MNRPDDSEEAQSQVRAVRSFNRFYTSILGVLNEMYLGAPVGLGEARVLYEITSEPGCKAGDLVERLSMDRGYLSRIITRLEKLDLLSRQPSPSDGRVLSLYATKSGQALMDELSRRSEELVGGLLAPLSGGERDDLITSMRRIQELLSKPAQ